MLIMIMKWVSLSILWQEQLPHLVGRWQIFRLPMLLYALVTMIKGASPESERVVRNFNMGSNPFAAKTR